MPSLVLARRNALPELSVTRPWSAALVRREDQGPVSGSNVTQLAIILGVAIPVVVAVIVLLFLHRRNVRRVRMEDAKESDLNLDFGMGEAPVKGNRREKSTNRDIAHKPCQLSMDMNLTSPYLLPPGAHQSHDSIHTLARSFRNEQDPYRPVTRYGMSNSETDSLTSSNPFHDPSTRSSSKRTSLSTAATTPPKPALCTSLESKSLASADEKVNPFTTPTSPKPSQPLPAATPAAAAQQQKPQRPVQPIYPEIDAVSNHHSSIDASLFPVPASSSLARPRSPPPQGSAVSASKHVNDVSSDAGAIGVAHSDDHGLHFFPAQDPPSAGLGLNLQLPQISSPSLEEGFFTDPRTAGPLPGQAQTCDDAGGHGPDHGQPPHHPGTSEAPALDDNDDAVERGRGMAVPAPSMQHSLDVPQQQQAKRLSVGYRPLPPDEVIESEDPEYRANRIRSFYREYFDDSREAAPPVPGQRRGAPDYAGYDMGYLGDAAYYDADTNAFVMPYAQPVTRRAMTPPPAGRFRGPPGGGLGGPEPRSPHGSIGGMSLPGGGHHHFHHRRPRAGSALGPRPGSSASAGMRGPPRRRLPPPADLKTLPTPSKLKDDSFALMNAIDFAPPDSYREYAAGRSQSPLGERRPYQPKAPVSSPLVTAFDELAALPSPHHLRKSATFTNLDFAPPKKFKDGDTMSDAGSVRSGRSNKSGISAMQLGALRNGAGRISRLPNDTVFTAAALPTQLKPQWGMRA